MFVLDVPFGLRANADIACSPTDFGKSPEKMCVEGEKQRQRGKGFIPVPFNVLMCPFNDGL